MITCDDLCFCTCTLRHWLGVYDTTIYQKETQGPQTPWSNHLQRAHRETFLCLTAGTWHYNFNHLKVGCTGQPVILCSRILKCKTVNQSTNRFQGKHRIRIHMLCAFFTFENNLQEYMTFFRFPPLEKTSSQTPTCKSCFCRSGR